MRVRLRVKRGVGSVRQRVAVVGGECGVRLVLVLALLGLRERFDVVIDRELVFVVGVRLAAGVVDMLDGVLRVGGGRQRMKWRVGERRRGVVAMIIILRGGTNVGGIYTNEQAAERNTGHPRQVGHRRVCATQRHIT